MRMLAILLALVVVTAAAPTATAAPPNPDDLADPDCFKQLAQPNENPADIAFSAVFVAVCLATNG